jgi:hypothetical protein
MEENKKPSFMPLCFFTSTGVMALAVVLPQPELLMQSGQMYHYYL